MKILSALVVAVAFSITLGVAPAFAADNGTPPQANTGMKSSPMSDADKQEYKNMLQEASTMMGYVGIANIALLHNMTDEAANSVQKALVIARKLEGQTAKLNSDIIKMSKLQYLSPSGEKHDYWLPIENDTFVVSNLDSEYLKSKEPKAAEADAQIVNTKVILDTKQVRDSLEKAATSISMRNYGDAQVALLSAQQSNITGETIRELPLVTARDNLVLARELAKSKDYDGAGFALNHAKGALKDYQAMAEKGKSALAEKLQAEISALQAEITKDKPSVASTIEKRIGEWINKIKGL